MQINETLAEEFSLALPRVTNIIELIDAGNTIPFIARYRKEQTGGCDDQTLRALGERLDYLRGLEERRVQILEAIRTLEKLTPELEAQILEAESLARLEDLYRPYKQKRRTRASVARERGLEPLAAALVEQLADMPDPELLARDYINPEMDVPDAESALAGARDIIAEDIADDARARELLRAYYQKNAVLKSVASARAAADDESKDELDDPDAPAAKADKSKNTRLKDVYEMYHDYREGLSHAAPHRVLAMNRGERDGFLKVTVEVDEAFCAGLLGGLFLKKGSPATEQVRLALTDAFKRLIHPSLEREMRAALTKTAAEQAIRIFGMNLKALLMQPPLKGRTVLAIDPAYRTGCKIAVVDPTGKLLDTTVVYPTPPQNKQAEAKEKLSALIRRHGVQALAIGNGTASKESEIFAAELISEMDCDLSYMMVNEAGASVYSASPLGAKEFPELDVSLRSAISLARRMQDPLAELVKIDPKSVGVGQYQHDMPPKQLDATLRGVVEDCVNNVGADLNTASPALLSYVAGLSATVANNIQTYREENGAFTTRAQLKKVPKLGPKAFQQCAGFLRIPHGDNVLDNTSVHPESYAAAQKLLARFGYTLEDVAARRLAGLQERVAQEGIETVAQACGVGEPTLADIIRELQKPGRDPRDSLPPPALRKDILSMEDLRPGMELSGVVRNVVDFGAFVDIGVHQDGLVHISRITDHFIKHPSEAVQLGDQVTVWVLEADTKKKRISLTMRPPKEQVE